MTSAQALRRELPPGGEGLEVGREPLVVAGALWVGVQALLCLAALPAAAHPGAALASTVGAALALAALVVLPGRRRSGPLPAPPAAAAAVLLPTAVLLDALAQAPAAQLSAFPRAPGLLTPALAVLLVRGRPGWAAASAAALVTELLWLRWTASGQPLWAPESALLLGPVLVWCTWGVVTARLRATTQVDLLRSRSAYALARERRRRSRERSEAHERRRALLEVAAVPLLQAVAAARAPLEEHVRAELTAVERDLRAELRGRDLLDPAVRLGAATARARGVAVDVVDHAPVGADLQVLPPLRALVAAALHACSDGEVTARRPPQGPVLTLVHVGSPASMRAVHAAVASHAERMGEAAGVSVDVSADEDAVVVEVDR
ncbi:hypothetical protein [Quadrisphaera sp. KR29]|uniref:hypothetical protein n=1 Tax=Quadrisphaera sp. KR29 TaxID=3461391 RepID=UPI0040439BBF